MFEYSNLEDCLKSLAVTMSGKESKSGQKGPAVPPTKGPPKGTQKGGKVGELKHLNNPSHWVVISGIFWQFLEIVQLVFCASKLKVPTAEWFKLFLLPTSKATRNTTKALSQSRNASNANRSTGLSVFPPCRPWQNGHFH